MRSSSRRITKSPNTVATAWCSIRSVWKKVRTEKSTSDDADCANLLLLLPISSRFDQRDPCNHAKKPGAFGTGADRDAAIARWALPHALCAVRHRCSGNRLRRRNHGAVPVRDHAGEHRARDEGRGVQQAVDRRADCEPAFGRIVSGRVLQRASDLSIGIYKDPRADEHATGGHVDFPELPASL